MASSLFVFLWLGFASLIYIPVGILLFLKASKKAIKNRSSQMVIITHWSNYIQCVILILTLYVSFSNMGPNEFDHIYRAVAIIVHYSMYFPFLLRCYRVYFIFKVDFNWDEEDNVFRKNIHRTSQKWLVKVYLYILIVVVAAASIISSLDVINEYFPIAYYDGNSESSQRTEIIYLFVLFIEEMTFVIAVFNLRNVNDDFSMSKELTLICGLWILTGLVSTFDDPYWRIESVIRNHLIMVTSSIYPLWKTYEEQASYEEALTIEMLQSLELILQSKTTLEAFEKALNSQQDNELGIQSGEFLQLWIKCELYRHSPEKELEGEIRFGASNLKLSGETISLIQEEVFGILNVRYFPIFKNSQIYEDLMRDITRQQIYYSRIMQTSLYGDGVVS
ncbi:unnamed protein product [Blepharisma stoltei]|uniref:RGS domain-containing protein n=1 Tax=Blepharisma stoltei TaxID=1481888 RepID=A0AAU9K0X7_9CILI|nr:unnamed protein product [Blepharisma stoltei]